VELHDATLLSIDLDWLNRSARVCLRVWTGDVAIDASGLSLVHAPRSEPWGPSSSVNLVVGPVVTGSGKVRLVIEMQSGDEIAIEAAEFTEPART
jgi:hypothetical protein